VGVEVLSGILITGRPVATGMRVGAFDRLHVKATGRVNFGGAFGGFLSTAVLDADGDNWRTPDHYPAPAPMRKNSLVVDVRTRGGYDGNQRWNRLYQGGTDRTITVGSSGGEVFLLANDATPDDNTDGWLVSLERHFPDAGAAVLAIDAVELTQAIQRPDGTVPLVAGKSTVVRVYPTGGSDRLANVTGECRVRRPDGRTQRVAPLTIGGSQAVVTARPRGGRFRDEPTSSLNFVLGGLPLGTSEVTAEVWVEGGRGVSGRSATEVRLVTTRRGPRLRLMPFLIALPAHAMAAPAESAAMGVLGAALRRWPFEPSAVELLPSRQLSVAFRLDAGFGWERLAAFLGGLIDDLDAIRIGFCAWPNTFYNGMALTPPLALVPSCVTSISGNAGNDVTACAHELGHCFGLHHVDDCGAGIPHSSTMPRTTEETGWRSDQHAVVPAGVPELMSYCGRDRFPSVVAYERVLRR